MASRKETGSYGQTRRTGSSSRSTSRRSGSGYAPLKESRSTRATGRTRSGRVSGSSDSTIRSKRSAREIRRKREERSRLLKIFGLILGAVAVVSIIVAGAGQLIGRDGEGGSTPIMTDHGYETLQPTADPTKYFAEGTTINGVSVSELNLAQAEEALAMREQIYELTVDIDTPSVSQVVLTPEDMKLTKNPEFYLENLWEQQQQSGETEFDADIYTVNAGALSAALKEKAGVQLRSEEDGRTAAQMGDSENLDGEQTVSTRRHDPKNATIVYNYDTGLYEIVPGEAEYELPLETTVSIIEEAIRSYQPMLSLAEYVSVPDGAIMADDPDIITALGDMNVRIQEIDVSYLMKDGAVESVSRNRLSTWMYFAEDTQQMGYDVDAIYEFIDYLEEYHTTGTSTQDFYKTGGTVMKIDVPAQEYSLYREAMLSDIGYVLDAAYSGQREAIYKRNTSNTINGGTYVEVDLDEQWLYFYENGNNTIMTPIVSGDVNKGYMTPTGVFRLISKSKDAVLRGADYETPVKYWMLFRTGGYGLHDAYWRVKFGEDEYKYNGSHGCVNMPPEAAKRLYDAISVGDYVIIYGGVTKVEPTSEPESTEAPTKESTEAPTTPAATEPPTIPPTQPEVPTQPEPETERHVETEAPIQTEPWVEPVEETEEPSQTEPWVEPWEETEEPTETEAWVEPVEETEEPSQTEPWVEPVEETEAPTEPPLETEDIWIDPESEVVMEEELILVPEEEIP